LKKVEIDKLTKFGD